MCPTTTSFILCWSINQLQCPWWSYPIRHSNDQSMSRMWRRSSPRCIRRRDWFFHCASWWYICFPCQCFATDFKITTQVVFWGTVYGPLSPRSVHEPLRPRTVHGSVSLNLKVWNPLKEMSKFWCSVRAFNEESRYDFVWNQSRCSIWDHGMYCYSRAEGWWLYLGAITSRCCLWPLAQSLFNIFWFPNGTSALDYDKNDPVDEPPRLQMYRNVHQNLETRNIFMTDNLYYQNYYFAIAQNHNPDHPFLRFNHVNPFLIIFL